MNGAEELIDEVAGASSRLVTRAQRQAEHDIRAPSALPGWSRAHLLSHVARNADGLRALLLAARSGQRLRMYASPTTRVADIEAGATRAPDVIVADVAEASERFVTEARAMPTDSWLREVAFTSSDEATPPTVRAGRLLLMRLQELELHHVDLDWGYAVDDIPPAVAERLLRSVSRRRRGQSMSFRLVATDRDWVEGPDNDEAEAVIRGTVSALLGWLSGRAGGEALDAHPRLPQLPPLS